jgi:glycosyltransferase involved in cell wall biosynthesis
VKVSIIITTFNSGAALKETLLGVLGQTVQSEIIVVDSGSTDDTLRIVQQFDCRLIHGGTERSSQRNIGARAALGDWLLILDADMVPAPLVAESCLAVAGSDPYAAVTIPQLSEGTGWLSEARALEKRCYADDPLLEAPRFFSRHLFMSIGGYDESLHAAEDWDLAVRLRLAGAHVKRIQHPLVHQEGQTDLLSVFRRMLYYEPSLSEYRAKHPAWASKQLNPLRLAIVRSWRILLARPLLTLGILVLKLTELVAIGVSASRRTLGRHDRITRTALSEAKLSGSSSDGTWPER